jgi:hypothetical protein
MSVFSSTSSSSQKSKRAPRSTRRRSGLNKDDLSIALLTEKHEVFSTVGDPIQFKMPVPKADSVYRMVTTIREGTWLTSGGAEVDQAHTFQIGQINATELSSLQGLFDQYKIEWLEIMLIPAKADPGSDGTLVSAIDFDSSATNTVANLITFQNALVSKGSNGHYRRWKPTVNLSAATTGSNANVRLDVSPWLDLSNTTANHFGLKVSVTAATNAQTYDLFTRFHLAFRSKI